MNTDTYAYADGDTRERVAALDDARREALRNRRYAEADRLGREADEILMGRR